MVNTVVFGFRNAKIISICSVFLLQGCQKFANTPPNWQFVGVDKNATISCIATCNNDNNNNNNNKKKKKKKKTTRKISTRRCAVGWLEAAVWQEHRIVLCACARAGHMTYTNAHIAIHSPYSIAGLRSSTIKALHQSTIFEDIPSVSETLPLQGFHYHRKSAIFLLGCILLHLTWSWVKGISCAPQIPGGALAMLPTLGVSSTSVKCQHIYLPYPHLYSISSHLFSDPLVRKTIEPARLEGFHISSSLVIASVFCQVMFFGHLLARVRSQD